jgi:hypothetical protein
MGTQCPNAADGSAAAGIIAPKGPKQDSPGQSFVAQPRSAALGFHHQKIECPEGAPQYESLHSWPAFAHIAEHHDKGKHFGFKVNSVHPAASRAIRSLG